MSAKKSIFASVKEGIIGAIKSTGDVFQSAVETVSDAVATVFEGGAKSGVKKNIQGGSYETDIGSQSFGRGVFVFERDSERK